MQAAVRARFGVENELSRARAELAAAGVAVSALTDSNPTRHGLTHPDVPGLVARHATDVAVYSPEPQGPSSARAALASAFGGDPADYWLTSSTSQAYAWLFALLADPGERVASPSPGYPLIDPIARLAGVGTVSYRQHYVHPHGWMLDPQSLTEAVGGEGSPVRAVIAVDPGNPTGSYIGTDLPMLEAACAASGSALIVDEVFHPFAVDAPAPIPRAEPSVPAFVLGGLSKLLCAPQLKLGWIRVCGPVGETAPLRDGLDAIADAFLPVSAPIAAALPELLTLADESVSKTQARLRTNIAALRSMTAGTALRVRTCLGGWTALLDVPGVADTDELSLQLLRRWHLDVHPGWFYDLASPGAVALSLLPVPSEFAAGVDRLLSAFDALVAAR